MKTNVKKNKKNLNKKTSDFSMNWDNKAKTKAKVFRKKQTSKANKTPENPTTSKPVKIKEKIKNSTLINSIDISDDSAEEVTIMNTEIPNKNKQSKKQKKQKNDEVDLSEKLFSETGKQFSTFNIHPHIVSNLEKNGFSTLTVVQEKAVPVVLSGRNVLIRSQTGSGKTLAYSIPIIESLRGITPKLKRSDGVQAIIVVPTRELTMQTHELFTKINTFQWVVTGILCGGEKRKTEKDRIRKGVNILIGTPGRLLDHIVHTTALKIDNVRCLVVDEADRMMEMGFRKDIVKLVEELDKSKKNAEYNPLEILKNQGNQPSDDIKICDVSVEGMPLKDPKSNTRQIVLLSATLTKAVTELADFTMKDYVFVDALDESLQTSTNSENFNIPKAVKQEYVIVDVKQRLTALAALIYMKSQLKQTKIFVFMASSQMVDFHYELFTKYLTYLPKKRGRNNTDKVMICEDSDEENADDSDVEEEKVLDIQFFKLHGSMEQQMRKEIFKSFRSADKGVLFCTDVAARGLDVPTADYIVQYNGPQTDDDYVHRVGRTGRVGQPGNAIIFLSPEEQEYVNKLKEHKVFLKKREPEFFMKQLCDLREENNEEQARIILQRRFENAVIKDRELYKQACFGHYASSFAIRDAPSHISKVVRGQISHLEVQKLNRKLDIYEDKDKRTANNPKQKKKKRSVNLVTSEFESGLQPMKKKKKN